MVDRTEGEERRESTLRDDLDVTLPGDVSAAHELELSIDRGTTVGRYLVLARLGSGAVGVVLSAYDPDLDRKVALKLLRPRGSKQDDQRSRLQREAQALAKLSHPNVVAVHDVGMHEGRVFVAMEYVAGQTLREWLEEAPRTPAQVIEVFLQAGRGLAAAHESGLVHRDFKPENVMIDGRGRVRVLDFGLAHAGEESSEDLRVTADTKALPQQPLLATPLTQTGALMGTPTYMAPEQFAGFATSARSDQFSYCVALYEALYGERPFRGDSVAALAMNVSRGQLRTPPSSRGVPTSARRAITRGLSVDPGERWPSMEAVLGELARDPAATRRAWVMGLTLTVGLVGGGYLLMAPGERAPSACAGMDGHLEGVWDDGSRARVEKAILATGVSYAPDTSARVQALLDGYTTRWVEARTEACEATRVRGEQSDDLLDRRMACLDGRLRAVSAQVEVLAAADAVVVEKAVAAANGLPTFERCSNLDLLLADVPPPEDPEVARQVNQVEDELARGAALEDAGKFPEALEVTTRVIEGIEDVAHEPAWGRAYFGHAQILSKQGKYPQSRTWAEKAYYLALRMNMADLAADAAAWVVWTAGVRGTDHDAALLWSEHARALNERLGDDVRMAWLLHRVGVVWQRKGEYDRSREMFLESLKRMVAVRGEGHLDTAPIINALGSLASARGEYDEARKWWEQSLALFEEGYGPEHPFTATGYSNLGGVAQSQNRLVEARELQEKALALRERALGPDHPEVGESLNNLGNVAKSEGKLDESRRHHLRALEIKRAKYGERHPTVGASLFNIGDIYREDDEPDPAIEHYRQSLAIFEEALGPDHPYVAYPLTSLGSLYTDLGRPGEGLADLERALKVQEAKKVGPYLVGFTRYELARALWLTKPPDRDRARARDSLRAAVAELERGGAAAEESLGEARAWALEQGIPLEPTAE